MVYSSPRIYRHALGSVVLYLGQMFLSFIIFQNAFGCVVKGAYSEFSFSSLAIIDVNGLFQRYRSSEPIKQVSWTD
jgi:hypothetical protein